MRLNETLVPDGRPAPRMLLPRLLTTTSELSSSPSSAACSRACASDDDETVDDEAEADEGERRRSAPAREDGPVCLGWHGMSAASGDERARTAV